MQWQSDLNKLLIVLTGGMGDIIMAEPTIRALRHRFPSSRIDFLGLPHTREVLRLMPFCDEFFGMDTLMLKDLKTFLNPAFLWT